jgi:hypothetical protein
LEEFGQICLNWTKSLFSIQRKASYNLFKRTNEET